MREEATAAVALRESLRQAEAQLQQMAAEASQREGAGVAAVRVAEEERDALRAQVDELQGLQRALDERLAAAEAEMAQLAEVRSRCCSIGVSTSTAVHP